MKLQGLWPVERHDLFCSIGCLLVDMQFEAKLLAKFLVREFQIHIANIGIGNTIRVSGNISTIRLPLLNSISFHLIQNVIPETVKVSHNKDRAASWRLLRAANGIPLKAHCSLSVKSIQARCLNYDQ